MIFSIVHLPIPAQAASTKYVYKYQSAGTITAGTYKQFKSPTYSYNSDYSVATQTYSCYKISIPENGYIKLTYKPTYNYTSVWVLPKLAKCKTSLDCYKNCLWSSYCGDNTTTHSIYFALNKGTYYITASDAVKVKYTFYKTGSAGNYYRAKAYTLAAGKNKTLCFNKGYETDRWYKITLTRKKTITVTVKPLDAENRLGTYYPDVKIYDATGTSILCSSLKEYVSRTAKVPKGTYYIKITASYPGDTWNRVRSFSWK